MGKNSAMAKRQITKNKLTFNAPLKVHLKSNPKIFQITKSSKRRENTVLNTDFKKIQSFHAFQFSIYGL